MFHLQIQNLFYIDFFVKLRENEIKQNQYQTKTRKVDVHFLNTII